MGTKYQGTSLDAVPAQGGSFRVTIADNVGRGNDGTSLPCKKCWVIGDSANSGDMRMKIGGVCSSTEGIPVPEFGTHHFILEIEIDDVASLYFYSGSNGDIIDILYRL